MKENAERRINHILAHLREHSSPETSLLSNDDVSSKDEDKNSPNQTPPLYYLRVGIPEDGTPPPRPKRSVVTSLISPVLDAPLSKDVISELLHAREPSIVSQVLFRLYVSDDLMEDRQRM